MYVDDESAVKKNSMEIQLSMASEIQLSMASGQDM